MLWRYENYLGVRWKAREKVNGTDFTMLSMLMELCLIYIRLLKMFVSIVFIVKVGKPDLAEQDRECQEKRKRNM
jgi:hypothetical protein